MSTIDVCPYCDTALERQRVVDDPMLGDVAEQVWWCPFCRQEHGPARRSRPGDRR